MKHVLTWQEVRDEFLEVAHEYPSLSAQWRERYRKWILTPDLLRHASGNFSEASKRFKAVATAAVITYRKKSRFREPLQLWLDLLRDCLESHGLGSRQNTRDVDSDPLVRDIFGTSGRYSDCGSPIYVTVRESSLMQESRKSLTDVRKDIGYTTNDEISSDGFHLRHRDGRLALDGVIPCVADTSARFCKYLELSDSASKAATRRQDFLKPHIAPTPRKPTLNAMANDSGIPQSSLSRWIRGESRLSERSLQSLASRLGVDFRNIPN